MRYGPNTASGTGTTRPRHHHRLVGTVTGTQNGNLPPSMGGPGAPPNVPPTPPPDPAAEALKAQNQLNLGISNANAAYQTGQVQYQTGYDAQGNRDYTNPYNQAALLEEHYRRDQAGTTNGYANQGQLYSGAYGRQQNENARNYSIGSNSLQNQAANAYHNLQVGQATNYVNYGAGQISPELQNILRALGVG